MKVKDIAGDSSDLHRLSEQKVELAPGEFYQHEWDLEPDEYESFAALIQTLKGEATVEFQGPPGPDRSKLKEVKKKTWLYAGKLTQGIKTVAVRIKAVTASTLRVTVAFVRKGAKAGLKLLNCKACKTLLRLCLNALLVSAGIHPLDIDLPMKDYLPIQQAVTHLSQLIVNVGLVPEGVKDFISSLGSEIWPALKGAVEWLNWATETVDRVFEAGCRVVGCCAEKKA